MVIRGKGRSTRRQLSRGRGGQMGAASGQGRWEEWGEKGGHVGAVGGRRSGRSSKGRGHTAGQKVGQVGGARCLSKLCPLPSRP